MKKFFFFCAHFFCLVIAFGQTPLVKWNQVIGGLRDENLLEFHQTNDSSYIIVAKTASTEIDTAIKATYSFLIAKVKSNGEKEWIKVFPNFSRFKDCLITPYGVIVSYNNYKNLFADDKFFITLLNDKGSVAWSKEIWSSLEGMENGDLLLVNDTTNLVTSIAYEINKYILELVFFNSKGSIHTEKRIELSFSENEDNNYPSIILEPTPLGVWQSIDEQRYKVKILNAASNLLCVGYSITGTKGNKVYFNSNLCFVNNSGDIVYKSYSKGKFIDLVKEGNEISLVRNIWDINFKNGQKINDRIVSDIYSYNGSFSARPDQQISFYHAKESENFVDIKGSLSYRLNNNKLVLTITKVKGKSLSEYKGEFYNNSTNTKSNIIFYGPNDHINILNTNDALIICGNIYKADPLISYVGGSDIMILKLKL
jgi:hypothetical protein